MKFFHIAMRVGLLGLLSPTLCMANIEKLEKRDWYEVRSPNFHVISDSGKKKTRQVTENLELFRHAVSAFLKIKRQAQKPTLVFALKDMHVFKEESKGIKNFAGFFIQGSEGNLAIVDMAGFSANTSAENHAREVLFHEYVHAVIGESEWKGVMPRWFNEGIASYLGTFRTHREGYDFGQLAKYDVKWFRMDPYVDVEALFNSSKLSDKRVKIRNFYQDSFKFVFYLYSHPEMVRQAMGYVVMINKGANTDEAFVKAFGKDYKSVATDIKKFYAKTRVFPKLRVPYGEYNPPQLMAKKLDQKNKLYSIARLLDSPIYDAKIETSIDQYKKVVDFDDKHLPSIVKLSDLYLLDGNVERSKYYLDKALEIAPENQLTLSLSGVHLFEQAKLEKFFNLPGWQETTQQALSKFQQSINKDPKYPKAYFEMLNIHEDLLERERAAEAVAIGEQLISVIKMPYVRALQGDFYEKNKQTQEAIFAYKKYCSITAHADGRCERAYALELLQWSIFVNEIPVLQEDSQDVYVYSDGSTYKGELKNGKPYGQGLARHSNGSQYEGGWVNGLFEGEGKFTWSFGQWHKGGFKAGQTHGKGEIRYTSESGYVGDFKARSFFDGEGVYTWSDGEKYTGEFANDQKHGKGKLELKDGTIHDVEWHKDKIKLAIKGGGFFYGGYAVDKATKALLPDGIGYCEEGGMKPTVCHFEEGKEKKGVGVNLP